ncbi:hypothetical protein C0991_010912 [Blastosporella zonata]|nr:hypothetical protein C0991_010912 [Blastosporella zonata]
MSSISSSSRPSSPTKPGAVISDVFKPNPHPYAIKTTSTGILSRSSSTLSSAFQSHNHYVPISPSTSPTKANYQGHSERGSRHRYSRSLTDDSSPRPLPAPPEDLYYSQQQPVGQVRSRADSLSETLDDTTNPKSWTFEQLATNVPEIADFIEEHQITGRAFLRFDDGVLDAYGINQHSLRSLILSHSRRLRQSMLQNRIWANSNPLNDHDVFNGRRSASPSKSGPFTLPDEEDDSAYLSSSSSVSSTSSFAGHKKRRNGRVHGMVASLERSASPEKAEFQRDRRSGSISSVEDNDQHSNEGHWRPLPFPPQSTGEYVNGPLSLPPTSFPNSFPHALNTAQSAHTTPHATGNGHFLDHNTPQPTGTSSRPLPATPLHPSLRPPPVFDDDDLEDETPLAAPKNTSGEMTMDELISVLKPDADAPPHIEAHGFVNTDRRRGRDKLDKRKNKSAGAAAWEMDAGETVKHLVPDPTAQSRATVAVADDELTVEELLALEGGAGVAAWVDELEGTGRTMKRVGADEGTDTRFGSISKGRSIGKGSGRISLNAGRKRHGQAKTQTRRVGELFKPAGDAEEEQDQVGDEERRVQAQVVEELELERMREIERQLLRAEEEERLRWMLQAEGEKVTELRRQEEIRMEEEHRAEEDRVRRVNEERLRELFQRQQRMEEEARHRLAEEIAVKERQEREEAAARERRAREEAAAEQRRQEDAEQRLASSIAENRRLLEQFRARLAQIEERIEELQTQPSPSISAEDHTTILDAQADDPSACLARRLHTFAAWAISTPLGAALPAALGGPLVNFVRGHDFTTDSEGDTHTRRSKSRRLKTLYPKTFHVLFGIGMCAFLLQGLVRWGLKGVGGIGTVGARGVRGR